MLRVAAGLLSVAVQAAFCFLLGGWQGLLLALIVTPLFGYAVAKGMYPTRALGTFVVDHTWSLLNTLAGSVFLTLHVLFRHRFTVGSGYVAVTERVHQGYAMTIGPVMAGATTPALVRHEAVHVRQARLLGPFYLPLVALNYVLFTLFPVWLFYHDRAQWPVRGPITYFTCGVYPNVFHEVWAYRVCARPEMTPPDTVPSHEP